MSVRIYSRFDRPSTIESPIGNGERSIFEERIVDGERTLVVTGKEDFKAFIEASKEETLIDNIINRFQNGDLTVLQRKQGFYVDITNMPSSLAEAQNMLIQLESNFNSLPVEDRELFGNSFDRYVSEVSKMSASDFIEKFNFAKQELKTDNILLDKEDNSDE